MRNTRVLGRLMGLLTLALPATAAATDALHMAPEPRAVACATAPQEPCLGTGCDECTTRTFCGDPTYSGSFVRQRDNGACVYQCRETRACTTTTCCPITGCESDTFDQTRDYRVRAHGYAMGACPQDQVTIDNFCRLGVPD